MSKILLKESEIRSYVRSLIREAMEMEGHASPKTIQRWINATPEEIASWKPERNQDPYEFADLQRMALRQPYSRRHLAQAARDIEDAWRIHNGLESLKTLTGPDGKRLRKIDSIDADGNPVFGSKTPEERKAAHREIAKMSKREADAKKKEIRKAEREAQNAQQERVAQQEREAREEAEMIQWCQENGIDPTSPQSKEMYAEHIAEEARQFYYEHGMDEFSADALNRRIAWLKNKIAETEFSSDTWDQKVCDSCEKALKDVKRILKQNFGEDGKQLTNVDKNSINNDPTMNMSNDELDALGKDGKEAAAEGMYGKDSDFMIWCKKFGCDANEQTKSVYDSYMKEFNNWCTSTEKDPSDPSSKEMFDEFYADYTRKQLNDINADFSSTHQDNGDNENDFEEEEIDDEPMYDDDDMRGRNVRRSYGEWDSIDGEDEDERFGYDEEEWN